MQIGMNIRKLRAQQHRTLQEIANACGFSKSLLSKIEHEVVIPPFATLSKIAAALGVNISTLLEEGTDKRCILATAEMVENSPRAITDKGYEFVTLAAEYTNKKIQPCLIVGKKNQVAEHSLSHTGEEFIYMLEGEMKFKIGNVEYLMKPGDNVYFDSLQEHGFLPVTDEVKYINIFVK